MQGGKERGKSEKEIEEGGTKGKHRLDVWVT